MAESEEREIRDGFAFTFKDGSVRALGVDKQGNLYWDGKPIVTKSRLRLSWPVNAAAIVAALATAVQAVFAVLTYWRIE